MTMAAPNHSFTVRRILVAADSSAQGRAALQAAADLGTWLHADIEGLFVEDINLVNLADLSVGRELGLITGTARPFDRGSVEARMQAEAAQARRALAALAKRARVQSSFRVVRGRVESEVITASVEGDLLVLGVFSGSVGPRPRPGPMALAAARAAPRSVLLLRPGARVTGKALVAYDGSKGAGLALQAGARLAGKAAGRLTVLLIAEDSAGADALQARITADPLVESLGPRFLRAPKLDLDTMIRMADDVGAGILVLSADNSVLSGDGYGRLLEQIGCPVLFVR
jgi:nucleotide-binding universal stress UspA family protein